MPFYLRVILYSAFVLLTAYLLKPTLFSHDVNTEIIKGLSQTTPKLSLPPLSPIEHQTYNRLADEMSYYHNHFRTTWLQLSNLTVTSSSSSPPSFSSLSPSTQIINLGLQFCHHLSVHHDIEEAYWFPVLAQRMEAFQPGHFASEQHKEIHTGLEVLSNYLKGCEEGRRKLQRKEVAEIMRSFNDVLWRHLDEEVVELRAENMRRYWSLEEMKGLRL